jgi:hypothetical protein
MDINYENKYCYQQKNNNLISLYFIKLLILIFTFFIFISKSFFINFKKFDFAQNEILRLENKILWKLNSNMSDKITFLK